MRPSPGTETPGEQLSVPHSGLPVGPRSGARYIPAGLPYEPRSPVQPRPLEVDSFPPEPDPHSQRGIGSQLAGCPPVDPSSVRRHVILSYYIPFPVSGGVPHSSAAVVSSTCRGPPHITNTALATRPCTLPFSGDWAVQAPIFFARQTAREPF